LIPKPLNEISDFLVRSKICKITFTTFKTLWFLLVIVNVECVGYIRTLEGTIIYTVDVHM